MCTPINAAILSAAKAGITTNVGNYGSVFVSGAGDQFWVDWNGPFNAHSNAPFDKLVTCDF